MSSTPTSSTLMSLSWSVITNPYVISAAACGVLALALSYFLSAVPAVRDAKLRCIAGDVRKLGNSTLLFKAAIGGVMPDLLLEGSTGKIVGLYERRGARKVEVDEQRRDNANGGESRITRAPRLSITLPLRSGLFCRDDYREEEIGNVHSMRILDRGLYFHDGRALGVDMGEGKGERVLTFNSRMAADTFVDGITYVKGVRERSPEEVDMFMTTFNVGNAQPPDDLTEWLGKAGDADIIAIGAQECSYTASVQSPLASSTSLYSQERALKPVANGGDVLGGGKYAPPSGSVSEAMPLLSQTTDENQDDSLSLLSSTRASAVGQSSTGSVSGKEHWHQLLTDHFPDDEYECIAKLSAWDRCLTIFVKTRLVHSVSRVRWDTANVGLGGVAGNKGAIGARFTVFDTDFVIINSHLAAHAKEVNRRNEDFASISNGLRNLRDDPEIDVLSSAVHHFFWMGDLNYRINLDRDEVLDLISKQKWDKLQKADQLLQEKAAGRAFQGFLEGKTDFPPTYRYEQGSRKYSAVKLRIPSYCDRILYRSLSGCKLVQHDYLPADDILTSDHSPVYSNFTASLVHTSGNRDLESIANEAGIQDARDLGMISPMISPMVSPRSLSMRSLIPAGLGGSSGSGGTGLQLQFKSLSARDIPEMDHGGRRIAVAKALHIHNHVGWKKHNELGEGQHADPYCIFHGNAVAELDEGVYRTRTVTASQNPVWETDCIPKMDLISCGGSTLRRKYVVITVKDEIVSRRDDVIGSAVLWLGDGVQEDGSNGDDVVEFSLPIMLGGRWQGEVSGSYVIKKM